MQNLWLRKEVRWQLLVKNGKQRSVLRISVFRLCIFSPLLRVACPTKGGSIRTTWLARGYRAGDQSPTASPSKAPWIRRMKGTG